MSISQKKKKDLNIKVVKSEIKSKLDNKIKSKSGIGIQNGNSKVGTKSENGTGTRTNRHKNSKVNINRKVSGSSDISTNDKNKSKSKVQNNSSPNSSPDKKIKTEKVNKSNDIGNGKNSRSGKINTDKEKYIDKNRAGDNTVDNNKDSKGNSSNTSSKINTVKAKYINNSKQEEGETENIGANSITLLKRKVSSIDGFVKNSKSNIKTGKNVILGTIKTSKYVYAKLRGQSSATIRNTDNGKLRTSRERNKKDGIFRTAIKTAYQNTKSNVIETLDDNKNDLSIRSTVDGYKNLHTTVEAGKRVYSTGLKITNYYKKKKNDNYNKIQTKSKGIHTSSKTSLHTKNNGGKIRTVNNKSNQIKKNKKRIENQIQVRKQAKIVAEKISKESIVVIKKIAAAAAKSKAILFGAIALFLIFFISTFSATAGALIITDVCIPNIEDPNKFKSEMNRIEAKANEEINAADRFKVKDERDGVSTSWKDVIAVYMAKYENEPPINFGKVDNDTSEEGGTAGDGDTETTFNGTYVDLIGIASDKYDVDSNLIAAVIKQESNFNSGAISSAGAEGLMQIMPGNFPSLGISNGFDPYQNVMGGSQLLQELCQMYNNDLTMVLIAYNLGTGNMQRLGIKSATDLYKAPSETRSYVPRVLAFYDAYKNGTELPEGDITGVVGQGGNRIDNELEAIYRLFNTLTEEEKEIEVEDDDGDTHTITIIIVTLTKHNIDYAMDNLNFTDDQKEMAMAMLEADVFDEILTDCDFSFKIRGSSGGTSSSGGGSGSGSGTIGSDGTNGTGEALTDEDFERLQKYIEDCLGTPYVMGGNTPGVALDCSAFVSYVFRESGVIDGRYTAQGLCNISSKVSENDLKPGDLIFFQGTYDTEDTVTHVGIYTGNGMMVHSGNPCQYTSFESAYWQEHLYGYGRLT